MVNQIEAIKEILDNSINELCDPWCLQKNHAGTLQETENCRRRKLFVCCCVWKQTLQRFICDCQLQISHVEWR